MSRHVRTITRSATAPIRPTPDAVAANASRVPTLGPARLPGARAVHVVDLDNQLHTADPTPAAAAAWWESYKSIVGPTDAIVLASSHHSAVRTWWELPFGRMQLLVRSGADGADSALVESIDLVHASARFDLLVLASEDHYFAPLLRAAEQFGLPSWVISSGRTVPRDLALAARLRVIRRAPVAFAA